MKIYIASRASIPTRSAQWRHLRDEHGVRIISTWIDEAGENETEDFEELWLRIHQEIRDCDRLVFYAEPGDLPVKGALIEVGIALAHDKPVYVIAHNMPIEYPNFRPLGSWINHPMVTICEGSIKEKFYTAFGMELFQ